MDPRGPISWPVKIGDSQAKYFDLYYFEIDGGRYVAGTIGDVDSQPVPLRIESACVFGHIFRGVKCDCGDQFEMALQRMIEREHGLVVYAMDDDARGHGVDMHFKLYELRQHEGRMDEREIFEDMGLELDARDYEPIVEILHHFGVESVEIMTNNPERIEVLEGNGIAVAEQIPLETDITEHNEKLLLQEKEWLGYETSYRTHDEWVVEFQRRRDENDAEYGYVVTYNHTEVVEAEFTDAPQAVATTGDRSEDCFVTVYANYLPPELSEESVDKLITVDGETWSERSMDEYSMAAKQRGD